MGFILTPYAVALGTAALISLVVAVIAWRRRFTSGGVSFALMMTAVVVWSFFSGLEASTLEVPLRVDFSKLSYIGTCSVSPLFLIFVLRYSFPDRRLDPIRHGLLWLIPMATVLLVATNEWHHLVWTSFTPSPRPGTNLLIYGHGPWYWVAVGYFFLLTFLGTIVLGRTILRSQRVYYAQNLILLGGAGLPWLGTAVFLSRLNPFPGLDLPSISFALTGLLLLWGMTRFRLLDLVPVARDVLVEKMGDGLLVLDARNRVIDINPTGRQLFGIAPSVLGQPVESAIGFWRQLMGRSGDLAEGRIEATLPGSPERHLDLLVSPLHDRKGRFSGRLIVLRDVTASKQNELERERLIAELQQALADVKTLRGLLPICASCKKIRDDKGYWRNIEHYLEEHSQAEFSHGLCPDCMRKLYPQFTDRFL